MLCNRTSTEVPPAESMSRLKPSAEAVSNQSLGKSVTEFNPSPFLGAIGQEGRPLIGYGEAIPVPLNDFVPYRNRTQPQEYIKTLESSSNVYQHREPFSFPHEPEHHPPHPPPQHPGFHPFPTRHQHPAVPEHPAHTFHEYPTSGPSSHYGAHYGPPSKPDKFEYDYRDPGVGFTTTTLESQRTTSLGGIIPHGSLHKHLEEQKK